MVIIRQSVLITVLVLAAIFLQGCPMGIGISLYNNSNEDLLILTQDDQQLVWSADSLLRFQSGENILKITHDERGNIIPLLSVKKDTELFNYKLSFYGLPDEYIRQSSGTTFTSGTIEYSLQLEKNGDLYIVMTGEPFPVENLKSQPPGFPIKSE